MVGDKTSKRREGMGGMSASNYLRTTQLFPDLQGTFAEEEDAAATEEYEDQLQQRFIEALTGITTDNRRTTFTELLDHDQDKATEEATDNTTDEDRLERSRILKELDKGVKEFQTKLNTHPSAVYKVIKSICTLSSTLWEANEHLKKKSNYLIDLVGDRDDEITNNKDHIDDLTTKLVAAEKRIAELLNTSQSENPGHAARLQKELDDQKRKTTKTEKMSRDFIKRIQELQAEKDTLQESVEDHEDIVATLQSRVEELEDRGRTQKSDNHRAISRSRSDSLTRAHDHLFSSQQPRTTSRTAQRTASRAAYRQRDDAATADLCRGRISANDRYRCERTTGTSLTNSTTTSRSVLGSINPGQEFPVATNRSVPEPPRFSGDSAKWESWVQKAEMKLRCTTFKYLDDGLGYLQGFLDDNAFQLVANRVPSDFGRKCLDPFISVSDMLSTLRDHYGDRNEVGKSMTLFTQLQQQKGEKFSDFYVKYQKYRAYVGPMDEMLEVHTIKGKLNMAYTNTLIGVKALRVKDMVQHCQAVEDDYEDKNARFGAPYGNGNAQTDSKPKADSKSRNGRKIGTFNQSSSASSTAETLPAKFKNLAPWSKEEQERCNKEGRCNRCRQQGHRIDLLYVVLQREEWTLIHVVD